MNQTFIKELKEIVDKLEKLSTTKQEQIVELKQLIAKYENEQPTNSNDSKQPTSTSKTKQTTNT